MEPPNPTSSLFTSMTTAYGFLTNRTLLPETSRPVATLPDVTHIEMTLTVLCSVIFLLGVVGNLLVLVVVSRNAEMRTPTNWFLVNLSVADLLVLLICMPSALIEVHAKNVWLLGDTMCKLVPYLEYVVVHASVLTIIAISFERYYATCYPLRVLYTCTTRRAVKIIVSVWVVSLVWAVPFLFLSNTVTTYHYIYKDYVQECIQQLNTKPALAYLLTSMVVFFVLPLFLLLLLYGFIGCQLARESPFSSSSDGNCTSRSRLSATSPQTLRTRKQVIVMLAIIIVLFFVCLLPNRVFTLWSIFSSEQAKKRLGFEGYLHFLYFARVMLYINSAVNPIIYNVVSTKFRSAFLRVICRNYMRAMLLQGGHGRRRPSGASMLMSHQSFNTRTSLAEPDGVTLPTAPAHAHHSFRSTSASTQ